MRFAEHLWRASLVAAWCAGAAGCGSLNEPMAKLREATGMAPPAAVATAASAVPAAPVLAKFSAESEVPVTPAAQRAFDDARRALAAGRTDDAERGFRALTRSDPELAGPHANLGLIHRQAGKLPEAVAELERAVTASPKQPVYLNQLGVAYRQQGRFAKAREAYEKAIALDPNYAAAQLNLGILHDLYLGDGPRALELYTRYLALTPSGDAAVGKWVADLKNRKPPAQQQALSTRKEQP